MCVVVVGPRLMTYIDFWNHKTIFMIVFIGASKALGTIQYTFLLTFYELQYSV